MPRFPPRGPPPAPATRRDRFAAGGLVMLGCSIALRFGCRLAWAWGYFQGPFTPAWLARSTSARPGVGTEVRPSPWVASWSGLFGLLGGISWALSGKTAPGRRPGLASEGGPTGP